MSIFQNIKNGSSQLSVFEKIIALNVIIFFAYKLMTLPGSTVGAFFDNFELPSTFSEFITQPWSIFTYSFLHYDFLHILFNMLWLFIIGRFFSNLFSAGMAVKIFVFGVLAGGILFMLAYNILPPDLLGAAVLVGASAGVRALLIFICAYMPNMDIRFFIFKLKLWHIGAFAILMDILGLFSTNTGGNIAHLGGALAGYIFATQIDLNSKFNKSLDKTFSKFGNLFKISNKSSLKVVHKGKS